MYGILYKGVSYDPGEYEVGILQAIVFVSAL